MTQHQCMALFTSWALHAWYACQGVSSSSRMAVGRNPYNMTSIVTGLVDDVRVTARVEAGRVESGQPGRGAPLRTRCRPMTT